MFTGIVEEIGRVKSIRHGVKSVTLEIAASVVLEGTQVGDSICTNGVCLTVTQLSDGSFMADVRPETVRRTSLAALMVGSKVNLERALTLQSRLGGHLVSGHIDGTGRIRSRNNDDNAIWLWIECGDVMMRYIIEKGSVTVQGVSLTVAAVSPSHDAFAVSLIPHTQGATTLHSISVGDTVNIENDVIAKYVEKLLEPFASQGGETMSQKDKMALYRNFMK